MLPTELSYLAQERCKELRGEIREPSAPFFHFNLKRMFASSFYNLGNKPASKPQTPAPSRIKAQ
jgi:hypothetical protein